MSGKDKKEKKEVDYSKPVEAVKVDVIPNDPRAGGEDSFVAYVRNKSDDQ